MTQKTSDYDTLVIGALLAIPTQVIGRRVAAAVVEQGFTDYRPTYQPVFQWCRSEGSRLTELAERAGVTRQSMGEMIDVLEQRGYVERVPDPSDGRAILIRRTQRGWGVNRRLLSSFSRLTRLRSTGVPTRRYLSRRVDGGWSGAAG